MGDGLDTTIWPGLDNPRFANITGRGKDTGKCGGGWGWGNPRLRAGGARAFGTTKAAGRAAFAAGRGPLLA